LVQLLNQFLAKHHMPQVYQSPYSPGMAPCDFIILPQIKNTLMGKRFDDVEMIELSVTQMRDPLSSGRATRISVSKHLCSMLNGISSSSRHVQYR